MRLQCLDCGWTGTGEHACPGSADAAMKHAAEQAAGDQHQAALREFVGDVAFHFRGLVASGVPEQLAAILTQQYHAVHLQRGPMASA